MLAEYPQAVIDRIVHDAVLAHLCLINEDLRWKKQKLNIVMGSGDSAIYNVNTGEVWELKKAVYSGSCRTTSAMSQLYRYTSNFLSEERDLELKPPMTIIEPSFFSFIDGDYTYFVNYWDEGNGIIRYSYKRVNTKPNREVVYVKNPVKLTREELLGIGLATVGLAVCFIGVGGGSDMLERVCFLPN